jgi:hypothetical protein
MGSATIAVTTSGPVKAVCVALQYVGGAPDYISHADTGKNYFVSATRMRAATKKKNGEWKLKYHYNLAGKYTAIT